MGKNVKPVFWIILAAAAACILAAAAFLAKPAETTYENESYENESYENESYANESNADENENQIQYMGQWYSREDLSEDTIQWLEWYNLLSPEEQMAISYVPGELQEPLTQIHGTDEPIVIETTGALEEGYMWEAFPSPLYQAIRNAILQKKKDSYSRIYDFACCDFVMLDMEADASESGGDTVVCYGWVLYMRYIVSEHGLEENGGCHIPTVLTFEAEPDGYLLKEYWEPRDGSYFEQDIRDKFPEHLVQDGMDSQKFIIRQQQSCYKQAVQGTCLDTVPVIRRLLDTLCSGPGASFNPQTIPSQNNTEYRELIKYGDYSLSYCLNQFEQGGETEVNGKIMAFLCEELLQTRGTLPLDAADAATGQLWYDTLCDHSYDLVKPYLNQD